MTWPEELPTPVAPPHPRAGFRARWIAAREASGSYPSWVVFAALAGMFATTFPITILTLSLGSIAAEFGVSKTAIAWVITAPMLFSAVSLPLLGKLGDLRGHRRIFLLGFAAASLTAALTALAWDAASLIGFRTLAAVVGGATGPSSMALIFSVYAPEDRVRAMGWWSMTGAAAPALGLVLGGPLVDWLGWRVVFLLQAALSVFALALAAFVLRETERQQVRFDWKGALVLALSVGGFMMALARVREVSFLSFEVAGALVVGLLALPWFVRIERRTPEPLLALELFGRRNFTAPMISNAFQGAAYMGAFVLAPFVLIDVFGFSLTKAAAIMLLRTMTLTLASPLGARLGMATSERTAATVGSVFLTVSLVVIAWAASEAVLPAFCAGLVLQGLGHGLALPSLSSAVANAVPERDLGIASAGNRLTSTVGTAFGITALTLVYGGESTSSAFLLAYGTGAVFAALSALGAFLMQGAPALDPQEAR